MPASSSIFIARVWSFVWSIASATSTYTVGDNGADVRPTDIDSIDAQLSEEVYIVL